MPANSAACHQVRLLNWEHQATPLPVALQRHHLPEVARASPTSQPATLLSWADCLRARINRPVLTRPPAATHSPAIRTSPEIWRRQERSPAQPRLSLAWSPKPAPCFRRLARQRPRKLSTRNRSIPSLRFSIAPVARHKIRTSAGWLNQSATTPTLPLENSTYYSGRTARRQPKPGFRWPATDKSLSPPGKLFRGAAAR